MDITNLLSTPLFIGSNLTKFARGERPRIGQGLSFEPNGQPGDTITGLPDWLYHSDPEIRELELAGKISVVFGAGELSGVTQRELDVVQADTTEVREWQANGLNVGRVSGGEITQTGPLSFDVAAGVGFVKENLGPNPNLRKVSWAAQSVTVPASTEFWNLFVDNTGTVIVQDELAGIPDHTQDIPLLSGSSDATHVVFLSAHTVDMQRHAAINHLYAKDVVGPTTVSGGQTTINSGVGTRLDVAACIFYIFDVKQSTPATSPIVFNRWYRDGSGGFTVDRDETDVDLDLYDDGSGTLATIPVGEYAKHLLFVASTDEGPEYHLITAQQTGTDQETVEAGPVPVSPSFMFDFALLLAGVVTQQGASAITSIVDKRPFLGQNLRNEVSESTDHGLLTGLEDDDHTQYLLEDGTRPMSGNLDMGTNAITNVGNVDGVDVSTHGNRHTSGGADEIDGDNIDIDWNPGTYTPDDSIGEAATVDSLAAHLKGIDNDLLLVWGNSYLSAASNTRTVTTSGTFQTKTSLVLPAGAGQVYRLFWSAVIDIDNTGREGEFRLYDVTNGAVLGALLRLQAPSTTVRVPIAEAVEFGLGASPTTVEIQYRDDAVGPAAGIGIQQARLEAWRIS